jgi:methylated-DNA-[protein]-cysteine S-methyltransferase
MKTTRAAKSEAATTVFTLIPSPIGPLCLSAHSSRGKGIAGLFTDAQKDAPSRAGWTEDPAPFKQAARELGEYFAGKRRAFGVPLQASIGTPFQQSVWQALREIPYGETVTYGDIARRIGRPSAVRAVGLAIGMNPWGIIVPCHRVVGSTGALTGFAGGLSRKRWLLSHEGVRVEGGSSKDDPRARVVTAA